MKCNEVENLIMSYIDGKLPDRKAPKFKAHLEACPLCREAYADEVEMTAAFRTDVSGIAASGFVSEVMDRIMTASEIYAEGLRIINVKQRVVVAVSAVAIAVLALIFWVDKPLTVSIAAASLVYIKSAGTNAYTFIESFANMSDDLIRSGESIYESAWSSIGVFTNSYLTIIGIITAVALVVCVGLVGAFREKIVEELRVS